MAARIASNSRSKIATPDLRRSPQRGISVASENWARQASVRRPKQRWVACKPPHCSPVRSLHSSASASSTSAAAASASSTPPATATAASTSTAATEAPTSTTTPTPTPSSDSTATTAAPTTSSSSLAPLALADAVPLTRSRRSADRLGANKVDSSSRGNRGQKRNEGAPLKERGTGVTTRGAYSGDASLCCKEALFEEVDSEGGRAKREEVVPDRAENGRDWVGAEQGPGRGSNGAGTGSGPGQVRDRVGAEQGPGRGSNGARIGSGPGQVRDGVGAGAGPGRGRGRAGTGSGPGQVRDGVGAKAGPGRSRDGAGVGPGRGLLGAT
ncbi:unnamed protein product [Closterium sp. NIES-53]